MSNYQWTPEDEAAYLEERKSKCDHCHPVHEDTMKWLESVANQDLIYSVYSRYGINPDTIYKEFEAEINLCEEERIIPGLIEHESISFGAQKLFSVNPSEVRNLQQAENKQAVI